MAHPELLLEYIEFCKLREKYNNSEEFRYDKINSINPTTLLPLKEFAMKKSLPLLETQLNMRTEIIPMPIDPYQSENVFQIVMKKNEGNNYGGEIAFKYIVAELIDNIYQHSSFSCALIAGTTFNSKGFSDFSIFDNGITIAGSFRDTGMIFNLDSEAIIEAVNGLSSKEGVERGHGLGSTLKIVLYGLKGQVFIVSGTGAIFIDPNMRILYNITSKNQLDGTMFTMRVTNPCAGLNIYDYVV